MHYQNLQRKKVLNQVPCPPKIRQNSAGLIRRKGFRREVVHRLQGNVLNVRYVSYCNVHLSG